MKVYDRNKNVLQAARGRIKLIFDNFKEINVSVSAGKDSTVLLHLCLQEALNRNRKIYVFFLDQEAEYENSIILMRKIMRMNGVIPVWYQVPIYLTNATSTTDYFLYAWGENEEWMREKEEIGIKNISEEYPKRFYSFFKWYEQKNKDMAFLIGLRADEGIVRYRAVTKFSGYNNLKWSTITNDVCKFYPIYDWGISDVWKFIYDYNIHYNKIYDLMYMNNYSVYTKMRVSNLIHEKAYSCLIDLPKYEPETYNKLCKRISGISTAHRYASEKLVFSNKKLPSHYKNWKEFRDFLLNNIENKHKDVFVRRFEKQPKNELFYKKQVGQLLINDYENSKSYNTKTEKRINEMKNKWRGIL